jgi:hypothetical protein
MAQKSSTRRHRTTDETRQHFRNSAESAQRTYEQATQAGQRIQEQAGAWWSNVMTNSEWQRQVINFSEIATETIPLAQRNVEQLMKLVDKSCRSGVEVMKKAVEVMPARGNGEMQSAWMELWISGSRAAQANSHAVMELGTTAIDSWTQFVRKVAKAAPEPHVPGA